ncbi:MAG: ATP-binding protein [Bacteroidetes bacterium]|nr:MAG: ATP-binding protein [Bacteroidota bacterium]
MLKLTSHLGSVSKVEPFVRKLVNKYRISPDRQGDILISLTEAVTNAIVHGNQRDAKKVVRVKLIKEKNSLAFQVCDEGPGFDYQNLPDPTRPENIEKPGGRGVFLIRELCDDVRFRENGRVVEMEFKL